MLVINIINVSLHCMLVVSCWSSIWQFANGETRTIVLLATFKVNLKQRVIISSSSVPLMRIIVYRILLVQVCCCWLLFQLMLVLLKKMRIRDRSLSLSLLGW